MHTELLCPRPLTNTRAASGGSGSKRIQSRSKKSGTDQRIISDRKSLRSPSQPMQRKLSDRHPLFTEKMMANAVKIALKSPKDPRAMCKAHRSFARSAPEPKTASRLPGQTGPQNKLLPIRIRFPAGALLSSFFLRLNRPIKGSFLADDTPRAGVHVLERDLRSAADVEPAALRHLDLRRAG